MSIWVRITDYVSDTAGSAIGALVEAVRTVFEGDPETRRRVAFSIAMIALSAKMAKADGVVTPIEVDAFQEIFDIPEDETKQVSMLFDLAKQDVAGFESYAAQLASLCSSSTENCPVLRDIIDGLFHIAKADDLMHSQELVFLQRVAEIFKISDLEFERIVSRHVDKGDADPYRIIGIDRDTDYQDARAIYLGLVREHHPDALAARGLPLEFIKIADDRMAAINAAWGVVEPELKSK
jgi:DnaJ like chaperone protein